MSLSDSDLEYDPTATKMDLFYKRLKEEQEARVLTDLDVIDAHQSCGFTKLSAGDKETSLNLFKAYRKKYPVGRDNEDYATVNELYNRFCDKANTGRNYKTEADALILRLNSSDGGVAGSPAEPTVGPEGSEGNGSPWESSSDEGFGGGDSEVDSDETLSWVSEHKLLVGGSAVVVTAGIATCVLWQRYKAACRKKSKEIREDVKPTFWGFKTYLMCGCSLIKNI